MTLEDAIGQAFSSVNNRYEGLKAEERRAIADAARGWFREVVEHADRVGGDLALGRSMALSLAADLVRGAFHDEEWVKRAYLEPFDSARLAATHRAKAIADAFAPANGRSR